MSSTAASAPPRNLRTALPLALLLLLGCGDEEQRAGDDALLDKPELRTGEEQRERLCSRPESDLVIDAFCGDDAPPLSGLMDLRQVMGLGDNDNGINQGYAATANSTSLSHRGVSAINPRIIFFRLENEDVEDNVELIALAYTRGEQFAELVVRSRIDGELQFYLVAFTLPCEESTAGCLPGDLLTEAVEQDWGEISVYAEEDLLNTPLDCRVCHQPDGPGSEKLLRMQEFRPPWNHWLWQHSVGGRSLIDDYYAAKGDETFAGIPGPDILTSQPGLLSALVFFAGSDEQPNEYRSDLIEPEVRQSANSQGGNQPADNSVPGESETWELFYEQAKRGRAITVPYHDVKITDADKLATMSEAYAAYREGTLPREDLPDIREVYPDDPELLARIGYTTEPDMDGEAIMLQACGQCHNEDMDQTLSRSRFDVDLTRVEPMVLERAISRITLPIDDPDVMPPARFRHLDAASRDRLVEFLRR